MEISSLWLHGSWTCTSLQCFVWRYWWATSIARFFVRRIYVRTWYFHRGLILVLTVVSVSLKKLWLAIFIVRWCMSAPNLWSQPIYRVFWSPFDQVSIWIEPIIPKLILDQPLDSVCWRMVYLTSYANINCVISCCFLLVSLARDFHIVLPSLWPLQFCLSWVGGLPWTCAMDVYHRAFGWTRCRLSDRRHPFLLSAQESGCHHTLVGLHIRASPWRLTKPSTQHAQHCQYSPLVYHKHYSHPYVSLLALIMSGYLVTSH